MVGDQAIRGATRRRPPQTGDTPSRTSKRLLEAEAVGLDYLAWGFMQHSSRPLQRRPDQTECRETLPARTSRCLARVDGTQRHAPRLPARMLRFYLRTYLTFRNLETRRKPHKKLLEEQLKRHSVDHSGTISYNALWNPSASAGACVPVVVVGSPSPTSPFPRRHLRPAQRFARCHHTHQRLVPSGAAQRFQLAVIGRPA